MFYEGTSYEGLDNVLGNAYKIILKKSVTCDCYRRYQMANYLKKNLYQFISKSSIIHQKQWKLGYLKANNCACESI